MKWIRWWWYHYLFTNLDTQGYCTKWKRIKCRINDHPNGVAWYSGSRALEPGMTCRDCGEFLG